MNEKQVIEIEDEKLKLMSQDLMRSYQAMTFWMERFEFVKREFWCIAEEVHGINKGEDWVHFYEEDTPMLKLHCDSSTSTKNEEES